MPDADLTERIARLEHQCATILVLSAINLFMNFATILAAMLISWS